MAGRKHSDALQSRYLLPNLNQFPSETTRAGIPITLRWMLARICGRHMKTTTKLNRVLATPTIKPPSAWATRSEVWLLISTEN